MKLDFETNKSIVPFVDNGFVNNVNFENGSTETMEMLRAGIKAAQDGNRSEARKLLLRVTDAEPNNENAWLWLASISEYPEELLIFLNNVLSINPNNERALEWSIATKSLLSKTFVQRGIDASKETHNDFAKQCFLQAIVHDNQNEMAWLWLSSVCDSIEEKSVHLQKVLSLNPANETALALLQSAKRQMVEARMLKAIAAAVADDREGANKFLQEVLRQTPELEDALVLKSYLAESLGDKVLCFKKILEFHPDNGLAQISLISLLAIMAKAEVKTEVENIEPVSDVEEVQVAENVAAVGVSEEDEAESYFDEPADEEVFEEENHFAEEVSQTAEENQFVEEELLDGAPTQKLEFSPNLTTEENYFEEADVPKYDAPESEFEAVEMREAIEPKSIEVSLYDSLEVSPVEIVTDVQESVDNYENYDAEVDGEIDLAEENLVGDESKSDEEFRISKNAKLTFPNYSYVESEVFHDTVGEQSVAEESFSEADEYDSGNAENGGVSATEENSPVYFEIEDEIVASNVIAENNYAPEFEELEQPSSAENHAATEEAAFLQSEDEYGEENDNKPQVEIACPFCNAENESNAFVCKSCRAILTLSNLEMLLAHQEVDTERLSQAVERMEVEKNLHDFSSDELKFLGIGQINLKHLRRGFSYLQEASKLNPNDVVLSSQVNALAIRLSEIEQQESLHSSMPKNRTILVVDDSATVRKLVSGKLEKCGHEVVCAIDGVDALEKINALVPDLILLDITMPRMDGYQVCKLIRNNEATKDVPIVMISGKDGFFDKVRGRMAGTTGYITKPFGPETLMKTVEAYIVQS